MSNSMNSVRVVQGMSQSLCIALLLLTCCALSVQNLSAQNPDHRVRNIVLVHGASHAVYVSRPKEVAALIEEAESHARETLIN